MAIRMLFRGLVQGVGFRFRTAQIAGHHTVNGFVRNLSDGSVELVVDGRPQAVRAFLEEVEQTMSANIQSSQQTEVELDEEFTGFRIQR